MTFLNDLVTGQIDWVAAVISLGASTMCTWIVYGFVQSFWGEL